MADRFDRGTAPAASCVAAELHFDFQWRQSVRACVLDQTATRLVYDIALQWSMQIGGFLTVPGINAGRELGPREFGTGFDA
jgi:hypothetical protein